MVIENLRNGEEDFNRLHFAIGTDFRGFREFVDFAKGNIFFNLIGNYVSADERESYELERISSDDFFEDSGLLDVLEISNMYELDKRFKGFNYQKVRDAFLRANTERVLLKSYWCLMLLL